MDGLRLADRIAYAGGLAARKAGVIADVFRPVDGACPIVPARRTVRLAVLAVTASGSMRGPAPFGVPYRQLILDQAYVAPGDYLVGGGRIWLVATNEPPVPVLGAVCNETVSIWRPALPEAAGANPYGAVLQAEAAMVLAGFPAALIGGGGGGRSTADLPDSAWRASHVAMLASVPGCAPASGDLLRDARGRQFVVKDATRYGGCWRLAIAESMA